MSRTYSLVYGANVPVAIRCTQCGMTSYNKYDVLNLYCGHCKQFHNDRELKDTICDRERVVGNVY